MLNGTIFQPNGYLFQNAEQRSKSLYKKTLLKIRKPAAPFGLKLSIVTDESYSEAGGR